jgi:hypothetical protein
VRWGRHCGLSSVVWMRSLGACCANRQMHRFSRRARFSCHGRNDQVAECAGRGWHVARASMPCRFTCGARGKGACTFRNDDASLGVQSVHERGQCAGWRVANGRCGRQPSIGHRRWWLGGPGGLVSGASLPPAPWSARACARSASVRERGRVRCRVHGDWQVGSWGSS